MTRVLYVERIVASLALIVGATACGGCAPGEQATVSGKVTLDGRPLDRGVVTFVNALEKSSPGISGQIESDGTYHVQIGQSGEVVAGEYAVQVDARQASHPRPDGAPPAPGESLLPLRYSQIETSGLRYHVRPGTNVIDIALAGEKSGDTEEKAELSPASASIQEDGAATPAPADEEQSAPANDDHSR
jgi:hypothetical protein